MYSSTLLLLLVPSALAMCPGFNYGIGDAQNFQNLGKSYSVYDASCNRVDGITTRGDPCRDSSGIFSCTNGIITGYRSKVDGKRYKCRTDKREGSCQGNGIATCVSFFTAFIFLFCENLRRGFILSGQADRFSTLIVPQRWKLENPVDLIWMECSS
jgi:hypothetical protein